MESLLDDPQQPVLSTPVFGLGGPDGPLPYAYQEWLQQRARQKYQTNQAQGASIVYQQLIETAL
ncbi:hypothetical protein HKT51_33895, partial [Pseudomonas aeruginosa]|nr:hypothetical protein [Pseudomonas aeruginosa]